MSEFKLPNGVRIGDTLYNVAHLDEITGKQQNYLVNTKYKSPVDHIEKLLGDLLTDLRDENNKSITNVANKQSVITHLMQIEDIQFLLVKLREISFGDRFFFEKIECTHCKAINSAEIKLSSLEVVQPPQKDPVDLILPKSGLRIEYKPLNLSELRSFGADQDRLLNNHITETIKILLRKLGDDENPSLEKIEGLKAMDNSFITKHSPSYAHLDNSITHACKECGKDFEFELGEMLASFFALSRT